MGEGGCAFPNRWDFTAVGSNLLTLGFLGVQYKKFNEMWSLFTPFAVRGPLKVQGRSLVPCLLTDGAFPDSPLAPSSPHSLSSVVVVSQQLLPCRWRGSTSSTSLFSSSPSSSPFLPFI